MAQRRRSVHTRRERRGRSALLLAALSALVAPCLLLLPAPSLAQQASAAATAPNLHPFSAQPEGTPQAPWRIVEFPGGKKPVTQFSITTLDGEKVLKVHTDKSYGTLVHDLAPLTLSGPALLRFRWRLDVPLLRTDLTKKSGDDSPVKVCALFDQPLESLSFYERNLWRVMRSAAHDPKLPADTLCYVWDHLLPTGTLLPSAFTKRLRMIVLNTGEKPLKQWVTHERDLAADFRAAFGAESPTIPPLVGLGVEADADNTADTSTAYVGDLVLSLSAPTP
jgi:hypothetical protein